MRSSLCAVMCSVARVLHPRRVESRAPASLACLACCAVVVRSSARPVGGVGCSSAPVCGAAASKARARSTICAHVQAQPHERSTADEQTPHADHTRLQPRTNPPRVPEQKTSKPALANTPRMLIRRSARCKRAIQLRVTRVPLHALRNCRDQRERLLHWTGEWRSRARSPPPPRIRPLLPPLPPSPLPVGAGGPQRRGAHDDTHTGTQASRHRGSERRSRGRIGEDPARTQQPQGDAARRSGSTQPAHRSTHSQRRDRDRLGRPHAGRRSRVASERSE